jgi:hypothetical protein
MRKITVLSTTVLMISGLVALSYAEEDWRYRNHPDRFKHEQLRDYDDDGVPNWRDCRDDNYNQPASWNDEEADAKYYEEDDIIIDNYNSGYVRPEFQEYNYGGGDPMSMCLAPIGFFLTWKHNDEVMAMAQRDHIRAQEVQAAKYRKWRRKSSLPIADSLEIEGFLINFPEI